MNLSVISQLADADTVALFVPSGGSIRLRQSQGLHEHDLEIARTIFQERRGQLEQGAFVEVGTRTLWPLVGQKRLEGVLYFDAPLPHSLPLGAVRRVLDQVQRWLREEPTEAGVEPAAPQLARYDPEEAMRQQLVTALLRVGGNVSAVAAALGVTRQTVYDRADRLRIDLARYRTRVRRRLVE